MSHILISQPRNPVTATYVILGSSIAYVLFWDMFTLDLLTNVLILSVFSGIIASLLYYIEPIQNTGNAILQMGYIQSVRKDFPSYRDINYEMTFGEPYFERDRNKIYGSLYLVAAIVIAIRWSPIPLQLTPLINVLGFIGIGFLIINTIFLILTQKERIQKVHYILTLERYSPSGEPNSIVKKVKDDLIAERWTSAMTHIDLAFEDFERRLKNYLANLPKYKEKWQNARLSLNDIEKKLESGTSFYHELDVHRSEKDHMKLWLYALRKRVHDLYNKLKDLMEFLQNKRKEMLPVLSNRIIPAALKAEKKDLLSYFYNDETFKPIEDNFKNLHEKIASRKDIEPTPSVSDVKEAIMDIKGLKLIFEPIIAKIEDIELYFSPIDLRIYTNKMQ